MVRTEEPVIGKRYLVVTSKLKGKKPFIGYTGIAIEPTPSIYRDSELNVVLTFDNPSMERKSKDIGQYVWRTGIEVILLEDQNYVR